MIYLVLKKKIIQKIFHLNQHKMKIYDSVLKMILTKKLEIFQASVSEKSLLVLLFASYYFIINEIIEGN